MKQTAFHIAADGTIEKCRKFPRCKVAEQHWAEAEGARIHLSNIEYLAEVEAKVTEFNAIQKDFGHPQHLHHKFSSELFHASPRVFAEKLEQRVAQNGSNPLYISARMDWEFRYISNRTLRLAVEAKPVINTENGTITRQWTATVAEYDRYEWQWDKKYRNHETIILDFEGDRNRVERTLKQLEQFFRAVVTKSDNFRGGGLIKDPYAEEVQTMMDRSMDMFNAIESIPNGNYNDSPYVFYGDFKKSLDEDIMIDVEYGRSTFSAYTFKHFFNTVFTFYNREVIADDAVDIRVTDSRGGGEKTSFWSLYRKDGVWRVQVRLFDGQEFDTVATNSEEVRGHIYWHIMNDFQSPDQEQALKVAQYGADLYTAVEDELYRHNNPVRLPLS